MADSCCHCRSADIMHGFDTFQCLTCGKITSLDGRPLLPDSMVYDPNHPEGTAQFGWPFADQSATIARGVSVCASQWGIPIQGVSMSDPQPVPQPDPNVEPEPEVVPEPTPESVPAEDAPVDPASVPEEVPASA